MDLSEKHRMEWEKNIKETEQKVQNTLAKIALCECEECKEARKRE